MSCMALQDKQLPEEDCILEDVERPRIERDRITELSMFMATELLHARTFDIKIERRLAHDIEPFCWTILYVIYARAAQDARLRTPEWDMLAQRLQKERADLFCAAWAPMTLLEKRTARIDGKGPRNPTSFRGISALLAYYESREDVAAVLQVLWTVILKLQPPLVAILDEEQERLWEKLIHPRARSAMPHVWPIPVKTWLRRRAKTENEFRHDILTPAMQFLEEISVKEEKDAVGLSEGAAHVDERVD